MESSTNKAIRIAAVLYPGCVSLDLIGPLEAFYFVNMIASEESRRTDCGYRIELLAERAGPVESMSGVRLHADRSYVGFDDQVDILLVPGMKAGDTRYQDGGLTDWIAAQAGRSQRIASICSGAFVLAHAGILTGHKVTTHWNHGQKLRETFPDVQVDDSRIFCRSGNIYSSAGVTAGIDLALSIIEEDFDRALALKVAKRMVVFLKRPGDQSQFSDLLSAQTTARRFTDLLDWIEGNLASDLTVDELADHCAMSPRNFSRSFRSDVGFAPMLYVRRRRLERARLLLEETDQPLASIARATGFVTADRFARAFRDACHTSPGQYRKRFQ